MTARRPPLVVAPRFLRAAAAVALLVVLLALRPVAARADGGLTVVGVRAEGHDVAAVVQLDPAPLAPLPSGAVGVTALGASGSSPPASAPPVRATAAPVLDAGGGTPVAIVVDTSAAPADRQQALSGSTGLLLRLSSDTPVAVVADDATPRLLTGDGAHPSDAVAALTTLAAPAPSGAPSAAAGGHSSGAALDLALQHLTQTADGVRVVVLSTSAPAPTGADADSLAQRVASRGAVLGVVTAGDAGGGWADVAARTGGRAVPAAAADPSSAYDTLLATLEARYLVRFTAPPGTGRVQLAVATAGQRLAATVDVPGAGGTGPPASAQPEPATRRAGGGSAWPWIVVAVLALLVAAAVTLLARRRLAGDEPPVAAEPLTPEERVPEPAVNVAAGARTQPATRTDPVPEARPEAGPEGAGPPEDLAALPGVRVFDLSDPRRPAEIGAAPVETAPAKAAPAETAPTETATATPVPARPPVATQLPPRPAPARPAPARPAPTGYVGRHRAPHAEAAEDDADDPGEGGLEKDRAAGSGRKAR